LSNSIGIFLLVSFISFIGSLQLGVVNVMVIKTVIQRNLSAAIWVAIGGSLPEMLYAILAIFASDLLKTEWFQYLEIAIIPLFLFIGIGYFLAKPSSIDTNFTFSTSQPRGFWLGFGLACLNPQLFPFWLSVFVLLSTYNLSVNTLTDQLAFIIGTSFGALVLLVGIAYLIHQNRTWVQYLQKLNLNPWVGGIFISIALIQVYRLLMAQ
jgi:threonine/homoserine/homoserine lactone efflux protein